jgi:Holliday junction DNA helicase RuvB
MRFRVARLDERLAGYGSSHYAPPPAPAPVMQPTAVAPVAAPVAAPEPVSELASVTATERTANPLRPAYLNEMIGQVKVRRLLRRVIDATTLRAQPLDHVLLVAASGIGKSTVANIIANELGVSCYQVQAPISTETLMELRLVMHLGDVLFIDEIHQQAVADRRGRSAQTDPEVLFHVLEDRRLVTPTGVLEFPHVTIIGATTDEGMLPEPFINRFPLRPVLEAYTTAELAEIARANGDALHIDITWEAARAFARASRGVPRQINNYVRNGAMLGERIDVALAEEVVRDLNRTTDDGLTLDMQRALVFIYRRGKQTNKTTREVTYKASVLSIAVGIGKGRDEKGVKLRVEPYLIQKGYLQVGHGGRLLTDAGVRRAQELAKSGVK